MNKNLVLAAGVAVIAVVSFMFLRVNSSSVPVPQNTNQKSMTINLVEYSDSSQSGTATLSDENGKLKVILDITGASSQVPQPAHIHTGNCPRIGPVVYGLTDVSGNHSETTLDTNLEELMASNTTLSINVHKSYDDFKTYTSCGDLKK